MLSRNSVKVNFLLPCFSTFYLQHPSQSAWDSSRKVILLDFKYSVIFCSLLGIFLNTVPIDLLTKIKRLAEGVKIFLIKINIIYIYEHAHICNFKHVSIL